MGFWGSAPLSTALQATVLGSSTLWGPGWHPIPEAANSAPCLPPTQFGGRVQPSEANQTRQSNFHVKLSGVPEAREGGWGRGGGNTWAQVSQLVLTARADVAGPGSSAWLPEVGRWDQPNGVVSPHPKSWHSPGGAAALLPNAGGVGELREVGPLIGIQGIHAVVCGQEHPGRGIPSEVRTKELDELPHPPACLPMQSPLLTSVWWRNGDGLGCELVIKVPRIYFRRHLGLERGHELEGESLLSSPRGLQLPLPASPSRRAPEGRRAAAAAPRAYLLLNHVLPVNSSKEPMLHYLLSIIGAAPQSGEKRLG